MKKIAYLLSFMLLFSAFAPAAMAKGVKKEKTELTAEQLVRVGEIESRVAEIKSMDFSKMSKSEISSVKTELKEMNKEARAANNGIYLSVGAIIIILLIVILLT
ncbi:MULTISPECIES: hypothetical protein [Rhodonellum]|uniref:Seryl-tRNA synthetase n=2 Tax=Rhodonellum TaxID=336827 RepID=A0A1H3LCM7_9BACT|nr:MULTISPECIES: hypothetical protein [Rhodonellum]MDO9551587.1 hypothetical protein [Rhodonellum sp.]SDY62152.1 hypothetical protein SAMN05444412_1025 [Rhodonellum ikkaensis]